MKRNYFFGVGYYKQGDDFHDAIEEGGNFLETLTYYHNRISSCASRIQELKDICVKHNIVVPMEDVDANTHVISFQLDDKSEFTIEALEKGLIYLFDEEEWEDSL